MQAMRSQSASIGSADISLLPSYQLSDMKMAHTSNEVGHSCFAGIFKQQMPTWLTGWAFLVMQGIRASGVSTSAVLKAFMVAPLDMTMDMHMIGLMYAPTDILTLMIMTPILDIEMTHVTRMGMKFSTEARGFGDVKISGLYSLLSSGAHTIHLNAGISLPTGDIDRKEIGRAHV